MKFNFAHTRLGAALVAAFAGGVILTGAFDLTPFSHAQQARVSSVAAIATNSKSVGDLSNSFVAIAEAVTPAVVSVRAESPNASRQARTRNQRPEVPQGVPPGFEDFFRGFTDPDEPVQAPISTGTGFIVSADGYILTNNHVVTRNDRTSRHERVTVSLNDGRTFAAQIIGNDSETDVAVLKIDSRDLPVAVLGDDYATRIGEWVLAIGNPLGLDFTVTAGIVSAKGRNDIAPDGRSSYGISDFIQTDAAINPGNSGGPLINARGEVIGINSAIASRTGYYQGYGFAIPITLARDIMNNLIEYGRIRASILGVSIQNPTLEDAESVGLTTRTGVFVSQLPAPNTPAAKAGIQLGDVILEVNGRQMDRVATLQRTIRSFAPGTTVDVKVRRRGGTEHTFKVKLEERTMENAAVPPAQAPDSPSAMMFDKLGISVEVVTPQWLQNERISGSVEGLAVTQTSPGRAAADRLRGLILTDVVRDNGTTPLKTEADLRAALDRARDGDVISFRARGVDSAGGGQLTLSAPLIVNVRVGGQE